MYLEPIGAVLCGPENLSHAPDADSFVEDVVAERAIHGRNVTEKEKRGKGEGGIIQYPVSGFSTKRLSDLAKKPNQKLIYSSAAISRLHRRVSQGKAQTEGRHGVYEGDAFYR